MMVNRLKQYIKRNIFKHIWNSRGYFPYYQQQVYFPKSSIIFSRAINEGIYESGNVKIMEALIKPNTFVLDIGANIGLMAIPMLASSKNVNVISVEPSPNSFPYLLKTQQHSRFNDRWSLVSKAMSNMTGKINFQLAKPGDAAYESILNTNRTTFINSIEVECTTIDHIWLEYKEPNVSFIKIDIEGADLLALKGAKECINKCKPTILMEWNKVNIIPFKVDNRDLMAFSKEMNYTIFALPYLTKCETVKDLELLYHFDENFLLIPNE